MLPDVETLLEYPYTRTTGPVLGPFFTALRDGRLLGIRIDGRVYCPPVEYDPETGTSLEPDLVEMGSDGTVKSWTWVTQPTSQHPFDHPFAFALVLLDGAYRPIVHALEVASPDELSTGMRVSVQFHEDRRGAITDFHFVPAGTGTAREVVTGGEPVTVIEQLISLRYREPLQPHRRRFAQGLLDGRFIGQRSPISGKVSIPGRGYDLLERVEVGEEGDLVLADRGSVTAFTVITPIQYYGQKETEPYIRASILLDGGDTPLTGVDVRGLPIDEFRIGLRLQAVWWPAGQRDLGEIDNRSVSLDGIIERWNPTGEPDADPDSFEEFAL
jgi:hypothetical protein